MMKTHHLLLAHTLICRNQQNIFESIHFGNTYYDANQPWKTRVDNIDECKSTIAVCTYLIANIANLLHPFLPFSSQKVSDWLGTTLKWEEQSVSVQRILRIFPYYSQKLK